MTTQKVLVNLGCGNTFVNTSDWQNYDFLPFNQSVKRIRLSETLPFNDSSVDLVYLSHVLEHIPLNDSDALLYECHRILKPTGVIRIVVPEFVEMVSTFTKLIEKGELQYARFVKVEIIDQCVRQTSGGQLKLWYEKARNDLSLAQFIRERNGHSANTSSATNSLSSGRNKKLSISRIVRLLERKYYLSLLRLMPSSYRYSLVSSAHVGEMHKWIYDYYELQEMLESIGFKYVERMSAKTSKYPEFPFVPLDLDSEGNINKGKESMFIEALKS